MTNKINNPSPASIDRRKKSLLKPAAILGFLAAGTVSILISGPSAERAHPTAESVKTGDVQIDGAKVKTHDGKGVSHLIEDENIDHGDIRPLEDEISSDLKAFEEANPGKKGVVIMATERDGNDITTKYVAVAESVPDFLESLESEES